MVLTYLRTDKSSIEFVIKRQPDRAGSVSFAAITSNPCFEVWPVLHFELRTAPFLPGRERTAAQEVVHHLSRYLPHYKKGGQDLFSQIKSQTNQAIAFAKRLEQESLSNGSDNPSTDMHVLVGYLFGLKNT